MSNSQSKAPAYQWYPKDWRSDEAAMVMTYEQRGIYRELLDLQWLEGSIPAQPSRIAMLLGIPLSRFERLWPDILIKFEQHGDRLVNPRLERQRSEQTAFHEMKRQAGALGGRARANKQLRTQRMQAARAIATHTKEEWQEMVAFFEGRCVRCGRDDMNVERDHIVPIYQGGHDGISNIQPVCAPCNASKGPEAVDFRTRWGKQIPSKWLAVLGSASSEHEAGPKPSSSTASADQEPPVPPAERGVVQVRTGPPTRTEKAHAVKELKDYRKSVDYDRRCPHEPQCDDELVCIGRIVQERREAIARGQALERQAS